MALSVRKLSPNFTIAECCKSQTAARLGINNQPNQEEINNMRLVAHHILEPCREYFGTPIAPSSFFRNAQVNKAIGGSASSQHCKGEAVDFEIAGIHNYDLAWWIHCHLDYDQLILEYYDEKVMNSGWVHCSYVFENNRRVSYSTSDGKTYSSLFQNNYPDKVPG